MVEEGARGSESGRGTALVLGAAALWATIGVASFGLYRLGAGPWEVSFWRTAIAAAGLVAWAAVFRRDLLRPPPARDLLLLGLFGAFGVALFFVSFQFANHLTSVAVAVVLLYTAPIFVMVGGHFLLGERLTLRRGVVALVVVAGVWATALGAAQAEVRVTVAGVVWGLVSAASYSAYYFFGRRYVPRIGVMRTLLYSLLAGAVVLGAAAVLAGHPPTPRLPLTAWALLAWIAIAATLLANGLYYRGLATLDAGRAAMVASMEPVIASLLALVLLAQRLTWVGWLGVATVVAGVSLSSRVTAAPRVPPPPSG